MRPAPDPRRLARRRAEDPAAAAQAHELDAALKEALEALPDPYGRVLRMRLHDGLDPAAMRRMKDRIAETARSGVAVLLSSHMLHLVEELCQRVVIIVGGKKALDGSLDEIRAALPDLEHDADLEDIFMRTIQPEGDR